MIDKIRHHPQVLQDYLEALADSAAAAAPSGKKLLFGYAEMKYRMAGGGRCTLCHAPVRHVVPVFSRRDDGESVAYDCLCQRCLLGEVAMAAEVELRIGEASVRYTREAESKAPATRTFVAPNKVPGGSN